MVMSRPVAPTQPHLARLRDVGVPIAALIASVASVGPYASATAQSAFNRLIEALRPA
jgi:hypothetical protein